MNQLREQLIMDISYHYASLINKAEDDAMRLGILQEALIDFESKLESRTSPTDEIRERLAHFLQTIMDYERESHNLVGLDGRGALDFVDIYMAEHGATFARKPTFHEVVWEGNGAFCNGKNVGRISCGMGVTDWIGGFDITGRGINVFKTEAEAKSAVEQSWKEFTQQITK
jgi:hypothetical protein